MFWTAFAPDFQALPRNVEYLECEDEFDIADVKKGEATAKEEKNGEDDMVDILTIDHVPVFQSDSEDEVLDVIEAKPFQVKKTLTLIWWGRCLNGDGLHDVKGGKVMVFEI